MLENETAEYPNLAVGMMNLDEDITFKFPDNANACFKSIPSLAELDMSNEMNQVQKDHDEGFHKVNGVSSFFSMFDAKPDQELGFGFDENLDQFAGFNFGQAPAQDHTSEPQREDLPVLSIPEEHTIGSKMGNDEKSSTKLANTGDDGEKSPVKIQPPVPAKSLEIQKLNLDIWKQEGAKSYNQTKCEQPISVSNTATVQDTVKTSSGGAQATQNNGQDINGLPQKSSGGNIKIDEQPKVPYIPNRKRAFKKRGTRTKLNSAGNSYTKDDMDLSKRRDVINKTILRAMRRFVTLNFREVLKAQTGKFYKNSEFNMELSDTYVKHVFKGAVASYEHLKFYILSIIDTKLTSEEDAVKVGLDKSELMKFYNTIYKYSNTKMVKMLDCKPLGEIFEYFKIESQKDFMKQETTILKNKEIYDQVMDEFSAIFKGELTLDQLVI